MELLEGETLRDRLADCRGAGAKRFPLDELLDIAVQIADGLEAAHEQGHHSSRHQAGQHLPHREEARSRFWTSDWRSWRDSVSDGAQQPAEEAHAGNQEERERWRRLTPTAPTMRRLTRTGVAMGTAGYMSPEQVRGEKLDARTDLFSFGLVLYEMATGQRAFTGDTAAILKDAILNDTPLRCRELNSKRSAQAGTDHRQGAGEGPRARFQSAAEMRADLKAWDHSRRCARRASPAPWSGLLAVPLIFCLAAAGRTISGIATEPAPG